MQQEELRASNLLYRSLFENMPNGLAHCRLHRDAKGRPVDFTYLTVNRAYETLIGASKQVLEKKVTEVIPGIRESNPELFEIYGRVTATGKPERFEIFIQSLKTWYRVSASRLTPDEFIAGIEVITEHKRAEEELRETNELLSLFIKHSPIHAYIKEVTPTQSRILKASENFKDMVGIPGSAMVGMTMADLFPADFAAKITADDWTVVSQGKILKLDEDLNGRNFTSIKFPIRLGGQQLLAGYTIDITERKQLELTHKRLLAILGATPDFVGFADAKTTQIIYINPAGRKMVGIGVEEDLAGYKIGNVHPEWANTLMREVAIPAATRDGVWTGECAFLNKDGREIPVLMVLLVHKSPGGEVEIISTVSHDITTLKQTEAQLQKLSQQLLRTQDAERRSIALDLHDSTAQRLVGLLLSLSSLRNHAKTASPGSEDRLDECMEITKQSIAEIRTLSFLLHPPQLEHFGLLGAIRDFATEFGHRSGIQLTLDLPNKLSGLTKEHEKPLFRVLQEALTNIHRHSGSLSATIRLLREERAVRLEVQDAGCGIPKDKLHALESESARYGVGISGMRERLKFFHGQLEIKSTKTRTTLIATLPLRT